MLVCWNGPSSTPSLLRSKLKELERENRGLKRANARDHLRAVHRKFHPRG
jgi:hypothetical protein